MNPIQIDELSIPGCVECAKFERFWETIKKDWPEVTVNKIDGTTPAGQDVILRHNIMASPGIIINGELFSMGGLDQKAFVEKLKNLKN